MKGVGLDSRISPMFLQAGCGFGGSCFPKDVSALVFKSRELGHEPRLLKEVLDTNERQKLKVVEHLERKLGDLEGRRIAVLGLSFKPETDDVRESPAIKIISYLKYKGASVAAHDPQGMENMKLKHPDIEYHDNPRDALKGSDAALIVTGWDDYKNLAEEDFALMRNKVIVEGRKVLGPSLNFEGVCW